MSDTVIRKALDAEKLLKWLLDLYYGTGDSAEKYAYGRVEQAIESGTFDIPVVSEGEIESLKAVTELAVRGLKEVLKDAPWESDSYQVSLEVIREIARLQNEPIS